MAIPTQTFVATPYNGGKKLTVKHKMCGGKKFEHKEDVSEVSTIVDVAPLEKSKDQVTVLRLRLRYYTRLEKRVVTREC